MTTLGNELKIRQLGLPGPLTLNYAESGSGRERAVVFLHGYADSWRSFERILKRMPPVCRCLAVDLRGHGDSSKPEGRYPMRNFVDDLGRFLEALAIQNVSLVGHSMGSLIAQAIAAAYPERVDNLVLISSAAGAKGNSVLQEVGEAIMNLRDPVDRAFIEEFQTPSLPVPPEFLQTIVAESGKLPARIWKAVFQELTAVDNADLLSRIKARTLLLWGSRDAIFGKDQQMLLAEKIPDARLIEYDAGHALHWEIPDRVAADIARFLNLD